MSGGSWNYLYMAELAPRPGVYREASARLRSLHLPRAAVKCAQLASHLEAASTLMKELETPLHDMEWVDSGDYGIDQLKDLS